MLDNDGEHSVAATAGLVHVGGRCLADVIAALQQSGDFARVLDDVLREVVNIHSA